jgi:hypothetical protein
MRVIKAVNAVVPLCLLALTIFKAGAGQLSSDLPRHHLVTGSPEWKNFMRRSEVKQLLKHSTLRPANVCTGNGICGYQDLQCGCTGGPGGGFEICTGELVCQPGNVDCGMVVENEGSCAD